jgi:hypothetical protein
VEDPRDWDQRSGVAGTCTEKLNLTMPTVVDGIDDAVNMRYSAWPERLLVLDRRGIIRHRSGIGPWGFKPAKAEEALKELLATKRTDY